MPPSVLMQWPAKPADRNRVALGSHNTAPRICGPHPKAFWFSASLTDHGDHDPF